ncbi:hypothetical protein C84B14_02956 [Salinisphaera sp. C84B14]|uniref:AAA family ATPase n=1 Tax=Salinisphaera sp. C84B14 TaxID=1304155 RepID=UPI00333F6066
MMHVLVTGGPGSGTSTLAEVLANRLSAAWIEADDYYWKPSNPPFRYKYDAPERADRLLQALGKTQQAVVAGSVMGWGDAIEAAFDRIIFLYTDTATRMVRLRAREQSRYGGARPGFLEWAAGYDAGERPGRSLARHQAWLAQRAVPVLRLDSASELGELTAQALSFCDPRTK